MKVQVIMPDELREHVRWLVARNRHVQRTYHIQAKMDRLIEECYAEDDIELAATLLNVAAARSAGQGHRALTLLMQMMVDHVQESHREH